MYIDLACLKTVKVSEAGLILHLEVETSFGRGQQARSRAQRSQDAAQGIHVRQQTRLVHRVFRQGRCVFRRVVIRAHPTSIQEAGHHQ